MGLEIGIEFYQKIDSNCENKMITVKPMLVEDIIKKLNQEDINWLTLNSYENTIFICGRNEINNNIVIWARNQIDNSDEFNYEITFNKELNGYELSGLEYNTKLVSADINDLEKVIDFNGLKAQYEKDIDSYEKTIEDSFNEIEILRVHQEAARTQIAFDGFQKQIDILKDRLDNINNLIDEYTNGASDFHIGEIWKNYVDAVKIIMNNCENIIVTMYVSY